MTRHRLYRGVREPPIRFGIMDTRQHATRKARNTSDLYRCLMDDANYDWPQRGKSAVCSTQYSYAKGYGKLCIVIPADNSECAATAEGSVDIWHSGMQDFNELFPDVIDLIVDKDAQVNRKLLDASPDKTGDRSVESWNSYALLVRDAIHAKIDPHERLAWMRKHLVSGRYNINTKIEDAFEAAAKWMAGDHRDFFEYMTPYFKYELYGFRRGSGIDAINWGSGIAEVWVEGNVMLVTNDEWDEFIGDYLLAIQNEDAS